MAIINSVIAGGGAPAPTGTMYIISNGTYNVADKAIANVQVPTTAPAHYIEKSVDANGKLIQGNTFIDLTGVTDVGDYVLATAFRNSTFSGSVDMSVLTGITGYMACSETFYENTRITSVDLSSVKTMGQYSCASMFYGCTGLVSADLSSLETLTGPSCGKMFSGCTGLLSISIPKLRSIGYTYATIEMFKGCTHLTSADLSGLRAVSSTTQNMFAGCTALANVNLSSLRDASGMDSWFSNCKALTSLSFPALKTANSNAFRGMLYNIPSITLHFPSNKQSLIESLNGYSTTAPFGATSGTVLFDLPAVVTLTGADSVSYERNPKYDTAAALCWRILNTWPDVGVPYYTSGTSDPAVGDTIYSDAACTTAVTTISAIA